MVSEHRFSGFGLVEIQELVTNSHIKSIGDVYKYFVYQYIINEQKYTVNIHHISEKPTARDLIGFNNTGNLCIWPSEEALAFYCLNCIDIFNGKHVLELGGGMTSLAGLLIAKYGNPNETHLTDGNQKSVENIVRSIHMNTIQNFVKCSTLNWKNISSRLLHEDKQYNFIICADCLFFDDSRLALVDTIWHFLSPDGCAIIVAPRRGDTLNAFVDASIKRGFFCQIIRNYNETIWQHHLNLLLNNINYEENLHYPILIKVHKTISK